MTKKTVARGRPKGSSNKASTHGEQRATEYGALLAAGHAPAVAARQVADKWCVSESTVYTDFKRHTIAAEDLIDDMDALAASIDSMLDGLMDDILDAIAQVTDEKSIRAMMHEVVDEHIDKLAEKAPHITSKSTTGGAFRDGLKRKAGKK